MCLADGVLVTYGPDLDVAQQLQEVGCRETGAE
jgi:hypothetical protein